MEKQTVLNSGIAAVKAGDFEQGRNLLKSVLSQDKNNVMAWLWYSKAQTTAEKRLECINRALAIDSNHPAALKMYDMHIQKYGDNSASEAIESFPAKTTQTSEVSALKSEDSSSPNLGSHIKHAGTNLFEQCVRLFLIAITGGFITYSLMANPNNISFLIEIVQGLLRGDIYYWAGSYYIFPLIVFLVYGFAFYHLFCFIASFFESIDIYQRGIVHTSFGQKRHYTWRDFTKAKVTNRRTRVIAAQLFFIPIHFTSYSIDLKSPKGNFSINKQYSNYRQIGSFVLNAISRYAEIR